MFANRHRLRARVIPSSPQPLAADARGRSRGSCGSGGRDQGRGRARDLCHGPLQERAGSAGATTLVDVGGSRAPTSCPVGLASGRLPPVGALLGGYRAHEKRGSFGHAPTASDGSPSPRRGSDPRGSSRARGRAPDGRRRCALAAAIHPREGLVGNPRARPRTKDVGMHGCALDDRATRGR